MYDSLIQAGVHLTSYNVHKTYNYESRAKNNDRIKSCDACKG